MARGNPPSFFEDDEVTPPQRPSKMHPPPVPITPPWYVIARGELGVREKPGAAHNPRILEYHKSCKGEVEDDETAWCSSFMNWCMLRAGIVGSRRRNARSWLTWGVELTEPRVGCIAVFSAPARGPKAGHVGFYVSATSTSVLVLGGNQGNAVSVAPYAKDRLLSFRWPDGVST